MHYAYFYDTVRLGLLDTECAKHQGKIIYLGIEELRKVIQTCKSKIEQRVAEIAQSQPSTAD